MSNKAYKLAALTIWGWLTPLAGFGAENTPDNTLRDPTQPASYAETTITNVPHSDIIISAIFANNTDHKIVIIGDHIFTIGEKISGSTIVAIDTKGITLKKSDGSEFRVELPYPTIKIPTKKQEGTP